METKCIICGNISDNQIITVKERIINKGDTFKYLKCSSCGLLSLMDIPENMSLWYPSDYNPYTAVEDGQAKRQNISSMLKFLYKKILVKIIVSQKNQDRWFRVLKMDLDNLMKRLYGTRIRRTDKILDIGCASGLWLDSLYKMGWENITGIDLFIPDNCIRQTKWRFIKGEIFDISNEKFDCIIMNHSFEHMSNPVSVLQKVNDLLTDSGICVIAVPLAQGPAWREYGVNYVQIDAPRHLFLYTIESMKILCEKVGLQIYRTLYDSHEGIFYYSEEYKKTNKSNSEIGLSFRHNVDFAERAALSNKQKDGDEAIFYIKKRIEFGG